jgi:hypothetical protein
MYRRSNVPGEKRHRISFDEHHWAAVLARSASPQIRTLLL